MSIELAPQSPLTRTVLTAFGRPELLPTDTSQSLGDIVTDFEKAFPEQTEAWGGEDAVLSRVKHFGPGVLRSNVMQGLQSATDLDSVAEMTETLGELAGGDERSQWLAATALEGLSPWTRHLYGIEVSPADPDSAYLSLSLLAHHAVQNSLEQAGESDGEAA